VTGRSSPVAPAAPLRRGRFVIRALGLEACGIEAWRTTDAVSATVHGNDERVPVREIRFGVEFYYRIVEQLAR